ncbi:uncharacterized protein LOC111077949 isoform X2 [Drosophila obscura]|uniref:uncharacterized protein LOC111077949 isoform X2 n=1 Tax=Drosophila obscura TaxID=7282 RepID=UPI000BA10944|nr:uncharacterized protein LOC111077949 isoform X2 [Drosophila obscura]
MGTYVDGYKNPLDSNAQKQDVECGQESVAEMTKELASLLAKQHLLTTAQNLLPSLMNSLAAVCKSDGALRKAAKNFKAVFEENIDLDKHLEPAYSALILRANPVAIEDSVTRRRASKLKCATSMRNIMIKSVVYAGIRSEYLQQKLLMQQEELPTSTLSAAEMLEILGILPTPKKKSKVQQVVKGVPKRKKNRC